MRSRLTRITTACNMQWIASVYANYTIILYAFLSEGQARCKIHSRYIQRNEELSNTANSRNLPLTVSQGSSVENATCSDVPDDGTSGCAFMSVVFGDLLLCQNKKSTVSMLQDIACLAEEVIIKSPLQFNLIRKKSLHYDVSEAYALLQEFK